MKWQDFAGPRADVCGLLERKAYERAARDRVELVKLGYEFREEEADIAVQFFEGNLKHHKGEWSGKSFVLAPWQRFIIREIFGWFRPDGKRRFMVCYTEVPRKNGKTELAAGVGLYLLLPDQEAGAEVYSVATKKDQARISFDAAVQMVKRSEGLRDYIRVMRHNLHCESLVSKFEPLGSDADTLDGLNPHGVIVDELHAHRDRRVWDVMITGMGARREPMMFSITTAGIYDPESIGWVIHQDAVDVLNGVIDDPKFFAFVAAADEDDDWTQPKTWLRANPNLDVSVSPDYLDNLCNRAKRSPSFVNTFLRLNLNRWTQQATRWISMEDWHACGQRRPLEDLRGIKCYGGLDLSSKLDLTALSLVFIDGDEVDTHVWFWVPEDTIAKRSEMDRVPYDAWVRDGWIYSTPGNVIDYDFIEEEVKRLAAEYRLVELAYDPWNATQTAIHLDQAGIKTVEVRQGVASLSEPAKEFEKLVVAGRLRHGDHPVLRWMANNVAVKEDANGNIRPDKERSSERIDGIVATIMALSRGIQDLYTPSRYENEGLLFI